MINKAKAFFKKHPTLTYVLVAAVGGVLTLSFGFIANALAPAANAVTAVKNKVTPGA